MAVEVVFGTTPYRTPREAPNDVSRPPTPAISRLFLARASRGGRHHVSSVAKIGLERANLTMQRLIVALCLSAAAALVPNSAAARSNSNAKAPLKVGCQRP